MFLFSAPLVFRAFARFVFSAFAFLPIHLFQRALMFTHVPLDAFSPLLFSAFGPNSFKNTGPGCFKSSGPHCFIGAGPNILFGVSVVGPVFSFRRWARIVFSALGPIVFPTLGMLPM